MEGRGGVLSGEDSERVLLTSRRDAEVHDVILAGGQPRSTTTSSSYLWPTLDLTLNPFRPIHVVELATSRGGAKKESKANGGAVVRLRHKYLARFAC